MNFNYSPARERARQNKAIKAREHRELVRELTGLWKHEDRVTGNRWGYPNGHNYTTCWSNRLAPIEPLRHGILASDGQHWYINDTTNVTITMTRLEGVSTRAQAKRAALDIWMYTIKLANGI